tara:strand:+ start:663 stop:2435 length:1773 start_codon:yes stop_codon:yes gene_type:complete
MAFNFKEFATAFMADQAKAINTRIQKADDYEDQIREEAERNKTKIGKRKALVNLAKTEINLLRSLGAKKKHINAAIAAGPQKLFDFAEALAKEGRKRAGAGASRTFSESEIDAMLDMPDEFSNMEMDPVEFYERSVGLTKPTLGSTPDPKRGFLQRAFALDTKSAVRAQMDKDAYYDGYSIMDINEMARQDAYDSMSPDAYFSFRPSKTLDLITGPAEFRDQMDDASTLGQARIEELRREATTEEEFQNLKRKEIKRNQDAVINGFISSYGKDFLTNPAFNVRSRMGDEAYRTAVINASSNEELNKFLADLLLTDSNISLDDTVAVAVEDSQGNELRYTFEFDEKGEINAGKINNRILSEDELEVVVSKLMRDGIMPMASISRVKPMAEAVDDTVKEALGDLDEVEEKIIKEEEDEDDLVKEKEDIFKLPIDFPKSLPANVGPRPGKNRPIDAINPSDERVNWDSKYKGKYDIRTGNPILPGRRPESGRDRKKWNQRYRDTHDPETGFPLLDKSNLTSDTSTQEQENLLENVAILDSAEKKLKKDDNDGILDLSKITTQEARIEAFDNLSIGSQFYDSDGSGPYTKTKER